MGAATTLGRARALAVACLLATAACSGDNNAGVPKWPCKNKAFDCETVPGKTLMVCLLNPDAGTGSDGGAQDAAMDSATIAEGGPAEAGSEAGSTDASAD